MSVPELWGKCDAVQKTLLEICKEDQRELVQQRTVRYDDVHESCKTSWYVRGGDPACRDLDPRHR